MTLPEFVPAVVELSAVKASLNKDDTADDEEIERLIGAAVAEYAELVRPLPGEYVETFAGVIILPTVGASVTSVADGSGSPVGFTVAPSGVVTLSFCSWPVTVTYTLPPLPANDVQTIVEDVAGLFRSTQRGGGSGRPQFGGDQFDTAQSFSPTVLFPRITALGRRRFSGIA